MSSLLFEIFKEKYLEKKYLIIVIDNTIMNILLQSWISKSTIHLRESSHKKQKFDKNARETRWVYCQKKAKLAIIERILFSSLKYSFTQRPLLHFQLLSQTFFKYYRQFITWLHSCPRSECRMPQTTGICQL